MEKELPFDPNLTQKKALLYFEPWTTQSVKASLNWYMGAGVSTLPTSIRSFN
jgi:hypothetical protein